MKIDGLFALGVIALGLGASAVRGELPPSLSASATPSPVRSFYVAPTRLLWKSAAGVENAEGLLKAKLGQAVLTEPTPPCKLTASATGPAGVLLDFGSELQGYVEIFTPITATKDPVRVRVRLGESAAEAMAELGGSQNAQNDHAVRDQVITLPWLGKITVGPSGFRFVRLDAVDPAHQAQMSQVRAVLQVRDVPYVGSFHCNDERLNRIWQVGAYTVHLNMQDYLWDGIKRDRLVWIGDMHPEVSTINAVFGFNEVVPKSLDLTRDITPVTDWMNGISSYSMWWVLIQENWWMQHGRIEYLQAQRPYLTALLKRLASYVDEDGKEKLDGNRFLDWPTSENKPAIHAGLQALLFMSLQAGDRLMTTLGDGQTASVCRTAASQLRRHVPPDNQSKQAAALLVLAGLRDAGQTSREVLQAGGARNVSTFYGYYVLEALARAGDYQPALELIRTYWGAMLERGATTFWEDFNVDWLDGSARIDELVPPGKKDLHGDYGAYCYLGFRHSLCHGWASSPTAWLSEQVLGVKPLEPGCRRVRIVPHLGDLKWAEGTYPTPLGPISVRHERQTDGTIQSDIRAPQGITVDRSE